MHQEKAVITVKVKTKSRAAQKKCYFEKIPSCVKRHPGGRGKAAPFSPQSVPAGSNTALCNVYVRDNHALLPETRN